MKNTTKNILWFVAAVIFSMMIVFYIDHIEINELRKKELRLQNEKLKIEIQILQNKSNNHN